MTRSPWTWEEELVESPDWKENKVCQECHMQYMTTDEVHAEECDAR